MVRRATGHGTNDDGVQDSFLDIIANIVGILILLVIVVGVRAAMQPSLDEAETPPSDTHRVTHAMLQSKTESVAQLQRDMLELQQSLVSLAVENEQRDQNRLDLATYVSAVENQLEVERHKLSETDAERLRLRSALAQGDFEWQQLMLQKVALASNAGVPETIVHTPTPIVRKHTEKTTHLRLDGGRVAVVPFEQLISIIDNRSIESHRRDLERQGGIGRLGPVDGFELHYAIISRTSPPGPGGARQVLSFLAGEIRPATPDVGELVDDALSSGSSLDLALQSTNPRESIVMIWVYPDTAASFRPLQTALRERGFAVDVRLLAEGTHISFSPDGRATAAQ